MSPFLIPDRTKTVSNKDIVIHLTERLGDGVCTVRRNCSGYIPQVRIQVTVLQLNKKDQKYLSPDPYPKGCFSRGSSLTTLTAKTTMTTMTTLTTRTTLTGTNYTDNDNYTDYTNYIDTSTILTTVTTITTLTTPITLTTLLTLTTLTTPATVNLNLHTNLFLNCVYSYLLLSHRV